MHGIIGNCGWGILAKLGRRSHDLFFSSRFQFLPEAVIFNHQHIWMRINYRLLAALLIRLHLKRLIVMLVPQEASIQLLSPERGLYVVQCGVEPAAHRLLHHQSVHLELVVALVAAPLVGKLAAVPLLDFGHLYVRPPQRLIQQIVLGQHLLPYGDLLAVFLVQRVVVGLEGLHAVAQELHRILQFARVGIPVFELLHLFQLFEVQFGHWLNTAVH